MFICSKDIKSLKNAQDGDYTCAFCSNCNGDSDNYLFYKNISKED